MSKNNFYEEDMMIAIQNDDLNKFISLTKLNKDWENHLLKEEEQYLIHYAINHKSIKILTYMFANNVNINKKDLKQQSILHISLEIGLCEISKILISKNKIELCKDIDGNNELFKCLSHNCNNCLKLLLSKNKFNWKDQNQIGNNIFHQAAIYNNYDGFKLLQKVFNPESFYLGENDWNILHFCAANGAEKIFNELIATGKFDINSVTKNVETYLKLSIKHCNYGIAERILKEGPIITQEDLKNALDGSNLTLYQKLKTEFEKQKLKPKSLLNKRKIEETEIIDLRKSMGNFDRFEIKKRSTDSFINTNANINQKKVENDKINMNLSINKKNDFSFKNDIDKNPLNLSYTKKALRKSSNGSMYNLLHTDKKEPNKNFQINLKTEHFLNFINLDPNDIIIGEKIYEAEICTVYMGKYLSLPVAIKKYNISRLTEENLNDFSREVNLLMSLRHPNIVTFIGKCEYKNQYLILTEYLEKKALKNILDKKSISLSKLDLLKMSFDIARAVYYLHTRKPQVFHRDLKSSNCLVDDYYRVKLCDFGISKIFESIPGLKTNTFSTTFWMAPEFLHKRVFTEKSDVYSYGILFWEIMNRDTLPFKNIDNNTFLFGDGSREKRPEINENMDKELKNLMKNCWHSDPNSRPTMAQVVLELEKLIELEENIDKK